MITTEFILGAIGATTLLLGAIAAILRARPDGTRAIVAASTELNESHREWMEVLEKQATRLQAANESRDVQLAKLRDELIAARDEIADLHREHTEEVGRMIAVHEADVRTTEGLRLQVADLRAEVKILREAVKAAPPQED